MVSTRRHESARDPANVARGGGANRAAVPRCALKRDARASVAARPRQSHRYGNLHGFSAAGDRCLGAGSPGGDSAPPRGTRWTEMWSKAQTGDPESGHDPRSGAAKPRSHKPPGGGASGYELLTIAIPAEDCPAYFIAVEAREHYVSETRWAAMAGRRRKQAPLAGSVPLVKITRKKCPVAVLRWRNAAAGRRGWPKRP